MARPQHKDELQQAAATQFAKLRGLIDAASEEERSAPFDYGQGFSKKEAHWERDQNLRDVLIHLYEWHRLLLNWVAANQSGRAAPFLPEPYNWRNYGEMNVEFWRAHQKTPVDEAWLLVQDSHEQVMQLIAGLSNEELFEKAHFSWTGTTSLGSYCVSATSSHYDWACKKLRMNLNMLGI